MQSWMGKWWTGGDDKAKQDEVGVAGHNVNGAVELMTGALVIGVLKAGGGPADMTWGWVVEWGVGGLG